MIIDYFIVFSIGIFIGANVGLLVAGLVVASRDVEVME